jgi:non-specific serine/threonine protein kinase
LPPCRPAASPPPVLDCLASLVDKSLLQRVDGPDGESRFSMLETIREHALERLVASGEEPAVRGRHAAYYLALAERHARAAYVPHEEAQLAHLVVEHDNLRAAVSWFDERHEAITCLRLAGALGWFWSVHGHFREGQAWLERALAQADAPPAAVEARALLGLGLLVFLQGDDRRAAALYTASLDCHRQAGDVAGTSWALTSLGTLAANEGELDQARTFLDEALALARELDDAAVGRSRAAAALSSLGLVAHGYGDLDMAASLLEEAVAGNRALGSWKGLAHTLQHGGSIARDRGDRAGALARYHESLRLARDHGDERMIANSLNCIGVLATTAGLPERAARLFGAASALGERIGLAICYPIDRDAHQQSVDATRLALGDAGFSRAWTAGATLSMDQAVAEALNPIPFSGVTPKLTRRERDVLQHIVLGHADREIAAALFLSHRTVEGHVSHLLAKLGVRTRAQAAAVAISTGLVPPDSTIL